MQWDPRVPDTNNIFEITAMSVSRLNVELPAQLEEVEDAPSDSSFRQRSIRNRLTGAALLTVLFALYWLYGWAG